MKAKILDSEALKTISPTALAAYARGEGWRKVEAYGMHADVYVGDGKPEIILPRTDRLADYVAVVSRLVGVFSDVNERDELATYRDLLGAEHDVVRVRAIGADDGSITLDAGVELVCQAREMLLAAACATRMPQSVYRAGANKDATEYMKRVRLGQTEHGSFVVTLMAPVPPTLQTTFDETWGSFEDEPMERKVTRRLMEALGASRNAVELAHSGDGASAFESAIAKGVSANMCEAVAKLIEQTDGLEISVRWARTRPTPEARRKIDFSVSDAAVLKEAARAFRAKQPRPGVTLFGGVHKLKRDQHEIEGLVTLKAEVDDKMQSVNAVLDQNNYSVAVRAHDAR
ncbi:MAG: hypothetical protein HQL38_09350, partial [Alphaproteobacteria bacterium]|nr:hypothetical protein [Alphaproteobacteria bacterium]